MSTRAIGRILDEGRQPWQGLRVEVRHPTAVYPFLIDSTTSGSDGSFTLRYSGGDPDSGRSLRFRVLDEVKRVLLEIEERDVEDLELSLGDRTIPRTEVEGLLVTLGKDVPALVSKGNKVELLIDGEEAFGRVAELIAKAEKSVFVKQLFFAVPAVSLKDPDDEQPALVFDFGPPLVRPERELIDQAEKQGIDVRILLNQPQFHPIVTGLPFLLLGSELVLGFLEGKTDVDEVERYFGASGAGIKVRGFRQRLPDGVMHGKLVLVDGEQAVCLGSPFRQKYFDASHAVENPRRGKTDYPQHDVSVEVEGPAVAALHEIFRLHWNEEAEASDRIEAIEPPDEVSGAPEENAKNATLQVVRTLSDRRFAAYPGGEKGVLEAYLRAIRHAKEYIYLENQYFTSDAIADALAEVLADAAGRPRLQVILLLNIEPQVSWPLSWYYPCWQRRRITQLRKQLPDPAPERPRLGVFTRWTHETATAETLRPRIVPVYVHSKVGIVDDKWATVGSANLDGVSLDANWLLGALTAGQSRATETNLVILNGDGVEAEEGPVALLRRRLFAEHLGIAEAALKEPPKGWLQLWQTTADAKLRSLQRDPTQETRGHVLPYPPDDSTHCQPREQMRALGIDTRKIDPLKAVADFDRKTGKRTPPKVDTPFDVSFIGSLPGELRSE